MKRKTEREKIMERLSKIAFGKSNDIVKLVFLDPEKQPEILEELDLTMLSEIKRTSGGAVEIKLVNRLDIIKLLLGEIEPAERENMEAARFFQAINDAAKKEGTAE